MSYMGSHLYAPSRVSLPMPSAVSSLLNNSKLFPNWAFYKKK